MARGPDAARETISSSTRSHFVNDEKYYAVFKDKIVDSVEYNISRNNHIA